MFSKRERLFFSLLAGVAAYLAVTFLFSVQAILTAEDHFAAFVDSLPLFWWLKLLFVILAATVMYVFTMSRLNIKDIQVGHGQHGKSKWMDDEEKKETYQTVPFGKEKDPGFLIGEDGENWVVDTSDNNLLLLGPPGSGKTTTEYIPAIIYNARVQRNTGHGASMLMTDLKGTLYNSCSKQLREDGYTVVMLNFRDVLHGSSFNLLYRINECIDEYKKTADPMQKAIWYGRAERYAKVCAAAVVEAVDSNVKSDSGDYFTETSRGLITGLLLMVSEYGAPNERHIISVFNLVLELNGQAQGANPLGGQQKSYLAEVLEQIDNPRIRNYVGAAMAADMRTSMNIFSSALGKLTKFIDAELEQMLCTHSSELNAQRFVEQPTAIFLICPDENTTRHFLASLFIRFFANDLIEVAENKFAGELPRRVMLFWDEAGNMPAIQDVDVLFSAIRSRGVRILIALQSLAQLNKYYSRERADIIKDTNQMLMFTFVSPSSYSTAETLSKTLGNETVLSGSVSYNNSRASSTQSMVGRPLLEASEIVTIPWGHWVVMKGGHHTLRTQLQHYGQLFELPQTTPQDIPERPYVWVHTSTTKNIICRANDHEIDLKKGMFD